MRRAQAVIRPSANTLRSHGIAPRQLLYIRALLAQMERDLITEAEQTKDREDAEGKKPWAGGRKRRMTKSQIESAKQLLTGGMSASRVAENLGVPVSTLYRWVPASSIKKHT